MPDHTTADQPTTPPSLAKDLLWIIGGSLILTALIYFSGFEAWLAQTTYDPHNQFAWWLRQYSTYPAIAISVGMLAFILIPPLRKRFPFARRLSLVWLAALIFGGGVLNQVVAKELVQRPRPRETVLLNGTHDYTAPLAPAAIKGKSFPSGHAVMGFIFAVPFFVWRRRFARAAWLSLAGGIAYGLVISAGRIVLGAHFLTDILWAATTLFIVAAIAARYIKHETDFSTFYSGGLLLFAAFCVVWFNKFEINMQLQQPYTADTITLTLPCQPTIERTDGPLHLTLQLKGYGAPISNLQPSLKQNHLFLERYKGLYRDLECNGTLKIPHNVKIIAPDA